MNSVFILPHCSYATLFIIPHCSYRRTVHITTLFISPHCSYYRTVHITALFITTHCSYRRTVHIATVFITPSSTLIKNWEWAIKYDRWQTLYTFQYCYWTMSSFQYDSMFNDHFKIGPNKKSHSPCIIYDRKPTKWSPPWNDPPHISQWKIINHLTLLKQSL